MSAIAAYETAPATRVALPQTVSFQKVLDDYASRLRRLAQLAEDHGLRFSLEPRANSLISGADGFLEIHRRADHKNLYCCLDVIHSAYHREDIPLAIEKLGANLMVFQLCDAVPGEMIHYPLGEGKMDTAAMLQALRKIQFEGFLMLEIYRGGKDERDTVNRWYSEGMKAVQTVFPKLAGYTQ